ncbi:hypothetical protein SAMN05216553_111341 [Lentzea fradiae]|uniref:Uncharacterized protein n=1 Tax=Lentzea fradiae TaxID=200378 RepID=A0A1G7X8Y9_9PSEU|nr:hypothetical protein [Lentzea fradiae]SDG80614.1 hypothetical protein SAMN05216553_111341 [Lentzea fradiae]
MGFNVTCTPGREAAAAMVRVTPQVLALAIYLDPVNIAIQLPPFPGGSDVLMRFCRELSREAAKLADHLGSREGRHALVEEAPDART